MANNISKIKVDGVPYKVLNTSDINSGNNIGIIEYEDGSLQIGTLTNGVEYIVGTQSSATNSWLGVSTDIGCGNSTIYPGKVIIYHLPQNGNISPAILNLTLADNSTTGPINVKYLSGTNVTNEFSAGYDIFMIYDGTQWKTSASGTAKRSLSIPFAKVDSTSTATAYTATVPGITELVDGTCVMLENGVVTSAAGFTININGLGAKPVFSNLTAATRDTTIFNVNYTMLFVYDSNRVVDGITGAWCCYRGYDANTNTIGYQLRSNSYSKAMTDITYRYRLLFSSADNSKWVPANTSTSTNATSSRAVCQTPINPFGEIVYYGTTASVAAGSRPSATNLWQQYTLSLGYSFNRTGAALTLTSWKPVYVKCAPQADGSAIMDATTPYVQDLPTTDDGKIYIFLGVAYNATSIELLMNHPVFYYKDGAIRQWNNAYIPAAVQSNWNETDTSSAAYIQNKPNVTVDSLSSNGVAVAGNNFFRSGSVFISDTKNSISLDHAGDAGIDIVANDGSDGTITLTASSDIELNTSGTNKAYYNDKEIATKDDIPTVGTLNTTNTAAQTTSASESLSGTINLHKISKTGTYNDLLNKPAILQPDVANDIAQGSITSSTGQGFDFIIDSDNIVLQDVLDEKANDSAVVHKTGSNIITGTVSVPFANVTDSNTSTTLATQLATAARQKTLIHISGVSSLIFTDANNEALTHAEVINYLSDSWKDVIFEVDGFYYTFEWISENNDEWVYQCFCGDAGGEFMYFTLTSVNNELSIEFGQNNYQIELESGTNIKTIDGNSLLGDGDLTVFPSAGNAFGNIDDVTTVGVYKLNGANTTSGILIVESYIDTRTSTTTIIQTRLQEGTLHKPHYQYRTKVGSNDWSAWTDVIDLSSYAPKASPAFTGTPTAPTAAAGTNTTQIATTAFVQSAINALPEPMIFKGSLGTGGTITTLPAASSDNEGFTYKVITAGTYASQSAKVGDTFISDGTNWILIPSGDEPSGTVTSVKIEATAPLTINDSSAITTSGTRTLGITMDSTPTANSSNPVTSGALKTALDAKANDSNVVHKGTASSSQAESIYGVKTFESELHAYGGIDVYQGEITSTAAQDFSYITTNGGDTLQEALDANKIPIIDLTA